MSPPVFSVLPVGLAVFSTTGGGGAAAADSVPGGLTGLPTLTGFFLICFAALSAGAVSATGSAAALFLGSALLTVVFPVAGIIVGTAGGAAVGALIGNGVDRKFVEDVKEQLAPGSSALFIVLKGGDHAAIRGVLEPYEGTLLQTTFDSDFEEQIRKALE